MSKAARAPKAGEVFRECDRCPEMAVVPAGTFMMGSPLSEERSLRRLARRFRRLWEKDRMRKDRMRYEGPLHRAKEEGPIHRVTIGSPFAVGVYPVTFDEWDACVSAGGCGGYRPHHKGWYGHAWGRGRRPVVNVSWDDAQAYVAWLSRETGALYRLLSESEWEYAARAGTTTQYWWGDDIGRNRACCNGCGSRWDDEGTAPVGSFGANEFGLHDVHGNVNEWVQDCWNDSYAGAPGDGSAWESGNCSHRVIRGGCWGDDPWVLKAATRQHTKPSVRHDNGFRVARMFAP